MTHDRTANKKPRRGRPMIDSEKLVLVGGKIPPDLRKSLECIASARDWTMSETLRRACECLVLREARTISFTEEKIASG